MKKCRDKISWRTRGQLVKRWNSKNNCKTCGGTLCAHTQKGMKLDIWLSYLQCNYTTEYTVPLWHTLQWGGWEKARRGKKQVECFSSAVLLWYIQLSFEIMGCVIHTIREELMMKLSPVERERFLLSGAVAACTVGINFTWLFPSSSTSTLPPFSGLFFKRGKGTVVLMDFGNEFDSTESYRRG